MGNQASLLKAELEKLRSEKNPEQLALARQRVDELEADNAKMKSELDESRGRLDEADKELNKLRECICCRGCAPSNNKGWKSHFFFVSNFRGWDFSLNWIGHNVNNSPPLLSKNEVEQLVCLRRILSSSKAIKSMNEDWLVEACLSSASRGMAYSVSITC
ncbi:hypothetical protein BHE74_00031117 [Ensete ventricosum]|nr:hypothetical protein BHE74_00031117 [Ensete ventricosum]